MSNRVVGKGKFTKDGKILRPPVALAKALLRGEKLKVSDMKRIPDELLLMMDKKPSTKKLFKKLST